VERWGVELRLDVLEAEIEIWAGSRFTPFWGSLRFPGRRREKGAGPSLINKRRGQISDGY
jgi:hypothetical protein